jgi:hypothetical protein
MIWSRRGIWHARAGLRSWFPLVTAISYASHDISPSLDHQHILEMEGGEHLLEYDMLTHVALAVLWPSH